MAAVIRRHRWLALVCVAMMLGAGVFLAMRLLARPQSVQAQVAESTVSTSQPASDQPFHWQRDIDPNLNANVRSEVEALKTGRYPERLSALVSARPFDRAAFKANPQAYLDVVEPGRVFQPAQPGPQVKAIRPTGEPFVQVAPDSSVALKVTAEAGAPVTFTSFDLGAFENQMTSITVLADEQGEAQATFTATAWTVGEVNILAASPLTSERVHFYVYVTRKRPTTR